MHYFANEWIMIPLFALCVFAIIYQTADRVIDFLHKKSLGKRDDIVRYLKLMGGDVNMTKLTALMLFMSFGMGALFFLLFWPNLIIGAIFGVAVTVVGWTLPFTLVKGLYERRCNTFVNQMVDGVTIMANGIKSGSSAQQAMQKVVEIMANPIAKEFETVLTQVQFGQSLEDALTDLGERIPRPDVQMFVTSINILKETGGNLGETFQTIVMVIRERQKVEKKIEAMTAQGIAQGVIVTMIPFVLAGVFWLVDPNFIKPMFTTTLGWVLCLIILALQIMGGIAIKKIVTIKV